MIISVKNKVTNKKIIFLIGFVLMFLSFQYGLFFQTTDLHEKWSNFQQDSESLVVGSIINEILKQDNSTSLKLFSISTKKNPNLNNLDYYQEVIDKLDKEEIINLKNQIELTPYKSQFGLQGLIWAKLSPYFDYSLDKLHALSSGLFAISLLLMFHLYTRVIPNLTFFAFICIFVCTLSPWTASIARNLYWVPFTWFLPSILAMLIYKTKNLFVISFLLILISVCFLVKALCGYEFLSFIVLLSITPLGYLFFTQSYNRKRIVLLMIFIILFELIGFIIALCIHAECRSGSISSGLISIWELDVKRRTFGEAEVFNAIYSDSLNSTITQVLWKYLGFAPYFSLILLASFLLVWAYRKTRKHLIKNIALMAFLQLLPPVSWYVLAKAHSYIHTHINFVLMDFGFVPSLLLCIYVCIKLLWSEYKVQNPKITVH